MLTTSTKCTEILVTWNFRYKLT